MAKATSSLPRESCGPNQLAQTKIVIQTAAAAPFIKAGSYIGRKADGTWANAGESGVAAPFAVAWENIDSTDGAQTGKEARIGRFLVPNVSSFYTIAKQFKEVNITAPEGTIAMLDGTRTFIIGLEPKTNQIIISVGEQLPSTPAA